MATKTVSDLLVQTLAAAGIDKVYGVSGDSLNGITDSIRRQNQIEWIHMRHEEAAAFAAGAEAHLTGWRSWPVSRDRNPNRTGVDLCR